MQALLANLFKACITEIQDIQRSTRLTPLAALTHFSFAVISMGGFIFSHSLAIDDELSLFSSENSWIRALQGRFLMAAIDYVVPETVTAQLPYLVLAICYVLSYAVILRVHGLSHNWKTVVGFLIFILFPTNWLSQEFSINVAGLGLGLLFCVSAAYLTSKLNNNLPRKAFWSLASAAVILLAAAISGFQSLVTLYLAIGAGSLLLQAQPRATFSQDVQNRKGIGTLLNESAPWLLTAIIAVAFQSASLKLLLQITNSQPHQIDVYFRSPFFMLRTEPLTYITSNLTQFLETYLRPGIFYGHKLWSFTALVVGGCVLIWQKPTSHKSATGKQLQLISQLDRNSQMAATFALLALPLALNIVSTPYRIPMRALVSLPYVAWLFSSLWLTHSEVKHSRSLRITGVILSSLLIAQCLVATSSYYAARAFNFRSDQLVASSIISALSQHEPDRRVPVTYLASEGALTRKVPYSTGNYSTAAASFFNWDNGSTKRMVALLRAMGVNNLQAANADQNKVLAQGFASMTPWPAPGSIRIIDQYLLVKFSD